MLFARFSGPKDDSWWASIAASKEVVVASAASTVGGKPAVINVAEVTGEMLAILQLRSWSPKSWTAAVAINELVKTIQSQGNRRSVR